ncbi:MAG: hypothetical protein RLW61_07895 [Gammaproteobacteria bacterium]
MVRLQRLGTWCVLLLATLGVVAWPAAFARAAAERAAASPTAWLDGEWRRTGERMRCLSLARIRATRVLDERHILFRVGAGTWYLNALPRDCHALDRHDALWLDTRTPRLCDLDWVRVIEPPAGIAPRGPACGLGVFERVERDDDGTGATPARHTEHGEGDR